MLLKFNSTRILGLPSGKTLIPGVNEHEDKAWAEDKKDSIIQHKLEIDEIEELSEMKEEDEGASDNIAPLLKMAEGKAIKMAKETGDRDLLNEWHEKESRVKVKAAIEAQLKEIANIEYRNSTNPDNKPQE